MPIAIQHQPGARPAAGQDPAAAERIPLVDLAASYRRHRAGIDPAVRAVIEGNRFIQGPELAAFETDFASFCGTRHAIGVGSGTAALHLALHAVGIGPGDRVALPSHTFIATAEPVSWLGATPCFVDIDPATGGMDPAALRAVIGQVAAVVAVHIHGQPVDLAAIGALAAGAGVPLIEDAAQAHGAQVTLAGPAGSPRVVRAGGYGRVGCFSFYPGKNLGAFGDAGALTTDDDRLAERLRMLRDHGRSTKYEHSFVGFAHRMDTVHAAVLGVKLSTLDDDNRRRRELAAAYTRRLAGVGDLRVLAAAAGRSGVFHHFVVLTAHRDALLAHLHARGVGAGVHYPVPVHLQPAYAHLGSRRGDLPATERFADQCLSLPIYPELTEAQLDRVVAEVKVYFDRAG